MCCPACCPRPRRATLRLLGTNPTIHVPHRYPCRRIAGLDHAAGPRREGPSLTCFSNSFSRLRTSKGDRGLVSALTLTTLCLWQAPAGDRANFLSSHILIVQRESLQPRSRTWHRPAAPKVPETAPGACAGTLPRAEALHFCCFLLCKWLDVHSLSMSRRLSSTVFRSENVNVCDREWAACMHRIRTTLRHPLLRYPRAKSIPVNGLCANKCFMIKADDRVQLNAVCAQIFSSLDQLLCWPITDARRPLDRLNTFNTSCAAAVVPQLPCWRADSLGLLLLLAASATP